MNKSSVSQQPTGWTPKQINDALGDAGLNQAAIARDQEVSAATVSEVIKGTTCSQRIHDAIAEAVGEDKRIIWPQFYLNGSPKRGRKMVIWHRQAA